MARLSLYRTYRFIGKDPVIDQVRTLLNDEGLLKKRQIVHKLSGVAVTPLDNWFDGETKRPQHATVGAVISALGYDMKFVKSKSIDIDKELKVAANWLLKQNSSKKGPAKKANGRTATR